MKVLVIHPFGIGDVIFSFPLIEAIRSRGCEVDFLCNERTEEIIARHPSVRRHHVFNRDHLRSLAKNHLIQFLKELIRLLSAIRRERYDLCFDLSMGREYSFFMMCLGVSKRIGLDYRGRGRFLTDRVPVTGFDEKSVRDYYLDLLKEWDADARGEAVYPKFRFDETADAELATWCEAKGFSLHEPWIVIAPGGGTTWGKNAHYKQWPAEHFAETARHLYEETKAPFIFLGGAGESDLCREVSEKANISSGVVMTGQSLKLVMNILRKACLFVGNDGGLLHLANLLGVPVVGIYGPVSEKVYGPLESASPSAVLVEEVACRPCYAQFKFPPCEHDKRCLIDLKPDRVVETAKSILKLV